MVLNAGLQLTARVGVCWGRGTWRTEPVCGLVSPTMSHDIPGTHELQPSWVRPALSGDFSFFLLYPPVFGTLVADAP